MLVQKTSTPRRYMRRPIVGTLSVRLLDNACSSMLPTKHTSAETILPLAPFESEVNCAVTCCFALTSPPTISSALGREFPDMVRKVASPMILDKTKLMSPIPTSAHTNVAAPRLRAFDLFLRNLMYNQVKSRSRKVPSSAAANTVFTNSKKV